MSAAAFNPEMVRRWLGILHGDAPGLTHVCSTGDWTGRTFTDLDAAARYATYLDSEGREGIYARVTTLRTALPPGRRGGAADTQALPALWADIDIAGPGHAEANLPPDEDAARKIITVSGLPDPTLWIHSGGGCYPIWLLDQPHDVVDDVDDARDLAAGWQRVIEHAAAGLGWKYGAGVGDLARVLRLPGTVNRKAGDARPCRFLAATATRYRFADLQLALAGQLATITPAAPDWPPATVPAQRGTTPSPGRPGGGISAGDDYADRTDWSQILEPHGWRLHYERDGVRYWTRPGKTTGISASTNALGTDRLHIFTTATAFEADESYSKLGALAELEYGGDLKAAAAVLTSAGFGQRAPLAGDPAADQRATLRDLLGPPTTTPAATVLAEPPPNPGAYGPTEDGLARALLAHHGNELRYCPDRGRWLHWTGYRWAWDHGETHRERLRTLARRLPDGPEDEWRRFKRHAMSAAGVTGAARLAQTDPAIVVPLDQLDAYPWELNTPGGIIDLRSGELVPSDPARLHTRCTAATPDFDRPAAAFEHFLADTFAGDAALSSYIQRLMGLSAIGTVLEQVFLFTHGRGANGKSTLIEAAMHALAVGQSGYAIAVPAEMFMVRHHVEHPTELAQLAGARLVVASELDDGHRFAEARMKQLTGRDSINARFMRHNPFTFKPSHTLWLVANEKPSVKTGGLAFWRRVRLLPFLHVVPPERRDPHLGDRLADEAPAILAWIARGAADYHAAGLRDPESVLTATLAYQSDQDTVARWLVDCCHHAPGQPLVQITTSKAREAYERWCVAEGEDPVSPKRFGMELRANGAEVTKSNGRKFYAGLALLSDDESDPEEPADHRHQWYR